MCMKQRSTLVIYVETTCFFRVNDKTFSMYMHKVCSMWGKQVAPILGALPVRYSKAAPPTHTEPNKATSL